MPPLAVTKISSAHSLISMHLGSQSNFTSSQEEEFSIRFARAYIKMDSKPNVAVWLTNRFQILEDSGF